MPIYNIAHQTAVFKYFLYYILYKLKNGANNAPLGQLYVICYFALKDGGGRAAHERVAVRADGYLQLSPVEDD